MTMRIYSALRKPPARALKNISGGRLGRAGMTDINPQWRYEALTKVFGACGVGWKFEIVELWLTEGAGGQIVAWAKINLYHSGPEWSDPIPGVGGSMFIAKEKESLYTSDEAYKMAITDAISTAAKMIGVAGDIYAGKWDGKKKEYKKEPGPISDVQAAKIKQMIKDKGVDKDLFLDFMGAERIEAIVDSDFLKATASLKNAKGI
jgi:hypothetical protein